MRYLYLDCPLWYDEACSWAVATDKSGIMNNLINIDLQHSPLYFVLLKFWINIFGQSEFVMRSLSFVFGIMTVVLSYVVAKKISPKPLYPALICAVSPVLVLFSAEVRMYSMVIFMVLLSINYLIDYEQKQDKKSLIKLVAANILIPYTFVGGILYNLSLVVCYGCYLYKNKKEKFRQYVSFELIECLFLIPYFILILYYAKMRSVFVISHEGYLRFSHIVDVIRNFFGVVIDSNIYWVSDGNYNINLLFVFAIVIPCVYFIIGFVKSLKSDNRFIKFLSMLVMVNFLLAVIFSALQINVFTVRYILYILPILLILCIEGLSEKYNNKIVASTLVVFVIACGIFSIKNSGFIKKNKELALKSTAVECDKLGLTSEDIVILPFGGDAPYYFRNLTRPRVFDADFHKLARNPYGIYYDKQDQSVMAGNDKYKLILDKINQDNVFSQSYFDYFTKNVTNEVSKGRYVLIAMYGTDNNAIVDIKTLRDQVKEVNKQNILDVLFKKFMCDNIAMLNMNFKFIQSYQKDNFTYYIFQKI